MQLSWERWMLTRPTSDLSQTVYPIFIEWLVLRVHYHYTMSPFLVSNMDEFRHYKSNSKSTFKDSYVIGNQILRILSLQHQHNISTLFNLISSLATLARRLQITHISYPPPASYLRCDLSNFGRRAAAVQLERLYFEIEIGILPQSRYTCLFNLSQNNGMERSIEAKRKMPNLWAGSEAWPWEFVLCTSHLGCVFLLSSPPLPSLLIRPRSHILQGKQSPSLKVGKGYSAVIFFCVLDDFSRFRILRRESLPRHLLSIPYSCETIISCTPPAACSRDANSRNRTRLLI